MASSFWPVLRCHSSSCVLGLLLVAASGFVAGNSWVLAQSPVEFCSQPDHDFGAQGEPEVSFAVVIVPPGGPVGDIEVDLDLTHSSIDHLEVELRAPTGETVRLHDLGTLGFSDNDILLTYRDLGVPSGSQPYNSGCPMQPSGDGPGGNPDTLGSLVGLDREGVWTLIVRDVVAPGGSGAFNSWCLRIYDQPQPPPVLGPVGFGWSTLFPSYDITWQNTGLYDDIEVLVDGMFFTSLPATATTYVLSGFDFLPHEVCVRGRVGGVAVCRATCGWVAFGTPDLAVCDTPQLLVDDSTQIATIQVGADFPIGDLRVPLRVTHPDPSELIVEIASPSGTTVRLHDSGGDRLPNLDLTYWDLGIPLGVQRSCECFGVPDGPGRLTDFLGESTQGVWELRVTDSDPQGVAVLQDWCLDFYVDSPPFAVSGLSCAPGMGVGTVDVQWALTTTYDELRVYVNGNLEAALAGTETSYTTLAVPQVGEVEVCIEPVLGGFAGRSVCCATVISLEEPLNLLCTSAPGSAVAELSWTAPIPYDSVQISVNGVTEAVLPGGTTSYTTLPGIFGEVFQIEVQGAQQGVFTLPTACVAALPPPVTFEATACSATNAAIDSSQLLVQESVAVGVPLSVDLVEVDLSLGYPAASFLTVDLTSPQGTTVRLHDLGGGSAPLELTYSGFGVGNGSVAHDCRCRMQASGDDMGPLGDMLSEFQGEAAEGDWQLEVMTSFPLDGNLRRWCLRVAGSCGIAAPTQFQCDRLGDQVTLTWVAASTYDEIRVLRDGVPIATLPPGATSYTEVVPFGVQEYRVAGVVAGCGAMSSPCLQARGVEDVIFRGELPLGRVDSVFALQQSLEQLGHSVVVIDRFDEETWSGVGEQVERLWMILGTFPHHHVLTQSEGTLLAELHTGDLGLDGTPDLDPLPIYIEGNDVWSVGPATPFAAYDGVEDTTAERGDNSLSLVVGADSGTVDFTGLLGGYFQDQTGNEYTDRLLPSGATAGAPLDLGGPAAGVVWNEPGGTYAVGIYYDSDFAPVLSQSFELGGYSSVLTTLVHAYVDALTPAGISEDDFQRGDVDGSGALQLNDPILLLGYLFGAMPTLNCFDAGDLNDDGANNLADAILLLGFLFTPGQPAPPAPSPGQCGPDPSLDALPACDYPASACP